MDVITYECFTFENLQLKFFKSLYLNVVFLNLAKTLQNKNNFIHSHICWEFNINTTKLIKTLKINAL